MSGLIQPFRPFKSGKLESLLDPTRRVFEGDFSVKFYSDRAAIDGYCWHCQSRTHFEMRLTPAQVKALDEDAQFRKNIAEHLADQLQNHHQCGLLFEGRDRIEDVFGGH